MIAQRALAEPVDREDRRLVDRRDRRAQPAAVRVAIAEGAANDAGERQVLFAVQRIRVRQQPQRVYQPPADPPAQLLGRGPREGDDQDVGDPEPGLEEETQIERGDRVRLARAGAGLDELQAGERHAGDVQGPHRRRRVAHAGRAFCPAASSGP